MSQFLFLKISKQIVLMLGRNLRHSCLQQLHDGHYYWCVQKFVQTSRRVQDNNRSNAITSGFNHPCWGKTFGKYKFAAKMFSEILILQLWNQTPFQTTTYFLHIYVVQGSQIWNEHVLTPSWLAVANITASAIGANDGKKTLRPLPLAKSNRSFCPSATSVID